MRPTTVRIAALLVIRPTPMTIYDLSKLLSTSRATLAPSLDEAMHLGILRSFRNTGDRKEYYELLVGKDSGWEWGQWRYARQMKMFVEPVIDLCDEMLRHREELPESVAHHIAEQRENFVAEEALCRLLCEMDPAKFRDWYRSAAPR